MTSESSVGFYQVGEIEGSQGLHLVEGRTYAMPRVVEEEKSSDGEMCSVTENNSAYSLGPTMRLLTTYRFYMCTGYLFIQGRYKV